MARLLIPLATMLTALVCCTDPQAMIEGNKPPQRSTSMADSLANRLITFRVLGLMKTKSGAT